MRPISVIFGHRYRLGFIKLEKPTVSEPVSESDMSVKSRLSSLRFLAVLLRNEMRC